MVKNLPVNPGDVRDAGSIPGSERTPGEGNGNTLQCSCLENPMDREAWWATQGCKESDMTEATAYAHASTFCHMSWELGKYATVILSSLFI